MIEFNDECYMDELELYESFMFDKFTREEVFVHGNTPIDYENPEEIQNLFIHYCEYNNTYYTYEGGYETYKDALEGLLDLLYKED